MRRAITIASLAALVSCQGPPARAQGATTYKARLSTVPVDTPMAATITGSGSVTATLTGTKLAVTGTFEGLQSPATVARVHRGPKGIRGPAAFDLKVTTGTSGTISGAIDLTPAQVADFGRDRFYVQLHSEKAPEGNLWGWLLSQESR